jgi:hypothetical protein
MFAGPEAPTTPLADRLWRTPVLDLIDAAPEIGRSYCR